MCALLLIGVATAEPLYEMHSTNVARASGRRAIEDALRDGYI